MKRAYMCGRVSSVCSAMFPFVVYLSMSVENWKRRTEIVSYCVDVVDKTMEEKRQSVLNQASDPSAQRQTQATLYADEVKVRVISVFFYARVYAIHVAKSSAQ